MTDVHGVCDTTFKEVRDVLAANLDAGEDLGASVAITIDGAPVVDMWGGWRDADRTAAVGARTRSSTSGRPPRR